MEEQIVVKSPQKTKKAARRDLKHFLSSLAFGLTFGLTAGIAIAGMLQVVLFTVFPVELGLTTDPMQSFAIDGHVLLVIVFTVIFVTCMFFVRPPKQPVRKRRRTPERKQGR